MVGWSGRSEYMLIKMCFNMLYIVSPVIVLIVFLNVYPWYDARRCMQKRRKYISSINIEDCIIDTLYIEGKYGIAKHKYTNEYIPIKKIGKEWVVDIKE